MKSPGRYSISFIVDSIVVAIVVLSSIAICSVAAWKQGYNKGYEECYAEYHLGRYYQNHIPTDPRFMSRPRH